MMRVQKNIFRFYKRLHLQSCYMYLQKWEILYHWQFSDYMRWNIEEIKTIPTDFNEKNIVCETKNFYIFLTFLLIIIA